jgi:hypothetical protein
MEAQDKYFDIRGLSEYSSLSVRTLRDYLNDPDDPIPFYCIKRKILIKKSEFDNWIKKYRTNNGKYGHIVEEILDGFEADQKR